MEHTKDTIQNQTIKEIKGFRILLASSSISILVGFVITCIPLPTIWILLFFGGPNLPTGFLLLIYFMVTFARVIVIIAWIPKRNPGTRYILMKRCNCSIHLNSCLDPMWIIYYHNIFWHYCATPLPNKYTQYWAKLQNDKEQTLFRSPSFDPRGRGRGVVDGFCGKWKWTESETVLSA